jgi:hypothetical protein
LRVGARNDVERNEGRVTPDLIRGRNDVERNEGRVTPDLIRGRNDVERNEGRVTPDSIRGRNDVERNEGRVTPDCDPGPQGRRPSVPRLRRRHFPMLEHSLVRVHALQPHPEPPQAGDVLDHLLGAVVQRPVVVAHVAQRE